MIISQEELNNIKNNIKHLTDGGSTIQHAVSVIASQNNINPNKLMKALYNTKSNNKVEFNDIKTSKGSFVILKDNPNKDYEVINIDNKESIVLRDLNTDETIRVKEEDILPIVVENTMKKTINEANYNLTIDGLETVDADKLSQILSLASEAENNLSDETDVALEPMDTEMNAYVNPEYDAAIVPMSDEDTLEPMIDDEFGYEDYEQFPVTESKMDEDVLLDPQSDDETYNAQRKNDESDEMLSEDDMGTEDVNMEVVDKLYDKIINNGQYDIEDIINGDDETPDAMDFVFKYGQTIPGYNGKHFREYCRIISDRLNDDYVCPNCSEIWDKHECDNCGYNPNEEDEYDEMDDFVIGDVFDESVDMLSEDDMGTEDVNMEVVDKSEFIKNGKYDSKDIRSGRLFRDYSKYLHDKLYNDSDEIDLSETEDLTQDEPNMVDEEIAECLRLAGVELNEVSEEKATKGKKDLPQVVGHKTAFSKAKQNGFKPGENQRPNYKCVRTKDVMGKESTEGFKQTLNVAKVCCNESKIKSICETATRMYAKKDHSEWLALDRRYIEKLILEGVGYTSATKMLLKAKQGK